MNTLTFKTTNVKIILALFVSLAVCVVQFIEAWVWSPAWTLGLFLIVLAMDYVSALLLSLKRGKGYDSTKSRKFFFQLFAQITALGAIYNYPKINSIFGNDAVQPVLESLPGWLFMFMFSYNILSLIKNSTLLGGFNGPVAKFLHKYIDPHKNEPK